MVGTCRPSARPPSCGVTSASATSSSTRLDGSGRCWTGISPRSDPREMDLGWHLGLEFMMEALFGGRPPGFPGAAEVLERYERRSGYEVRDLAWHEVFALPTLAINDRHQRITGDEHRRGNPMGDILLARLEAASGSVG